MSEAERSFESLIGPSRPPAATDRRGLPLLRRTNDGHVIALNVPEPQHPEHPWLVIYASCTPECPGVYVRGIEPHPTHLKPGYRLNEHAVGPWPFLNQWGYHEDQVLEHLDGQKQENRALRKENGRLSAALGAARAELARAREQLREERSHPIHVLAPQPPPSTSEPSDYLERRRRQGLEQAQHAVHEQVRRALFTPGLTRFRRPVPAPKRRFLEGCRQVDGTWLHGRPHTCPASTNRGWTR